MLQELLSHQSGVFAGRVVIVSSVKGMNPWPADAAYHVTKHALETMTDSLRLEMQKFGVKVAKVRPGNFSSATACQTAEHVNHRFYNRCSSNFCIFPRKNVHLKLKKVIKIIMFF